MSHVKMLESLPEQLSVVRYLQFVFALSAAPYELLILKTKERHQVSAM